MKIIDENMNDCVYVLEIDLLVNLTASNIRTSN